MFFGTCNLQLATFKSRRFACDAERVGIVFFELDEGGLAEEVAAEEHAVADLLFVEMGGQVTDSERGVGFHPDHEAEPRAV